MVRSAGDARDLECRHAACRSPFELLRGLIRKLVRQAARRCPPPGLREATCSAVCRRIAGAPLPPPNELHTRLHERDRGQRVRAPLTTWLLFGATGFTGKKTGRVPGAFHAPAGAQVGDRRARSPQARGREGRPRREAAPRPRRSVSSKASVDDPASLAEDGPRRARGGAEHGGAVHRLRRARGEGHASSKAQITSTAPASRSSSKMLLTRYARRGKRAPRSGWFPSCGFDAIPADLGVLFTVLQLPTGAPVTISGYLKLQATFLRAATERSAIKIPGPAGESHQAAPPPGCKPADAE